VSRGDKEKSLLEELQGKEFDIVYDTIGGHEHWEVAKASLKKGGRFVTIVGDGGSLLPTFGKAMMRKLLGAVGLGFEYSLFLTDTKYEGLGNDMAKMMELIKTGKVVPVLDERSFELTQEGMQEFIQASMSHRAKGKLILQVLKDFFKKNMLTHWEVVLCQERAPCSREKL
jgi:NADPH:quinone reductase-like Zn-dependent oxidoreductase